MAIRSSQEASPMLNGFKNPGRIALIGAKSEIGLAIVSQLPEDKSREVILVGRSGDYALDVTDRAARERVVEAIFDKGDLDLAIIAVGVLGNNPDKSDTENLVEAMGVNYLGSVHGTILVISSFAQVRPRDDNFAYGSTKAGLDFYARGLSAKLQGSGVKIKILRPGFVKSKMTAGMAIAPFSITTEECAQYGVRAISSKKVVTWAPSILKYVAMVFATMPPAIFRKISQR